MSSTIGIRSLTAGRVYHGQKLCASRSHDLLNLAHGRSGNGFHSATNQLPFVIAVARQLDALSSRNRQITSDECGGLFDSIKPANFSTSRSP